MSIMSIITMILCSQYCTIPMFTGLLKVTSKRYPSKKGPFIYYGEPLHNFPLYYNYF